MHFSSTIVLTTLTLLAPLVTADLHWSGICIDQKGGQSVYNDAATKAACAAHSKRNTGSKQWDICPDCTIKTVGGLTHCNSAAKHIGGDELNYYCKQNGAGASLAD
ncbi:hypothetical protein BU23DRAFT_551708 [Bimuria novae-zelandiae CBS 107.79]|uniref:Uncharacterized protein n=1 Tax=Bimuria novae-zelandiae CBS 107.79 TaxID=1447943 RepID=A0A6A5VGC7_9PLEO|nr:hypothetical protein BU23DRAFT_551708 [Bimuria novae-zelandiae CBS 107.79]